MSAALEQRREAMERANDRRRRGYEVVAELASCGKVEARVRLCALLLDPSPAVGALRVRRLLCALPGCGRCWSGRVLALLGRPDPLVRDLTARQRAELARLVMLPRSALPAAPTPPSLVITPERVAAAERALRPFVASPVASAAARAALWAAAGVEAS